MDNQLVFVYERAFDGPSFNSQSIQEEFERDRETVKQLLAATDRYLEPFNSSLRARARERIECRRQKFRGERQLREELPYAMTAEKRMPRTSKPIKTTVHYPPHPPPSSQEPEAPQPPSDVPEITHSPDYRSVTLRGRKFSLTPMQAQVIKILHKSYLKSGTSEVGEGYLLEEIKGKRQGQHPRPI